MRAFEIREAGDVSKLPIYRPVPKKRPNSRKRAYQAALHSAHFRKLRKQVLERDDFRCQMNLSGCTEIATTANHKTYDRLGAELPDDLEAACNSCQLRERERRLTRKVLGPYGGPT